jgi:hypothetical protein
MRPLAGLALVAACSGPATTPLRNTGTPRPAGAATDSTLALFEPAGKDCVLRRVDPIARVSRDLAQFPGSCSGARIAWRADLERAAVWFQPGNGYSSMMASPTTPAMGHPEDPDTAVVERRYEIVIATGATTALPPLPFPEPAAEIAYAKTGALFAFAERDLPQASGTQVVVEGRTLDFTQPSDGTPAAALAYRLESAGWVLASVSASNTGWDYALGWAAAPESKALGPRSAELLEPHADTREVDDAGVRRALEKIAASSADADGWTQLATEHGPLYVWNFVAEFTHTTGRIAWPSGNGAALLPDLDFTAGDLVAVSARGRYLLVASANAGAYPRLYDLVDRKLVWSSNTARAVTPWPRS